jgi:hypothetical protein
MDFVTCHLKFFGELHWFSEVSLFKLYTNDGKPESAIAYSKLDYWMETEDGS